MTVEKLIEKLKTFPQDADIEVFDLMEGVSAGTVVDVYINKKTQVVLKATWYQD